MAMTAANINDVVFEKILRIESYHTNTREMVWMANQLRDATLNVTGESREVTDASNAPIATFYDARRAELEATSALFNLPLAAAQGGNPGGLVRGAVGKGIAVPRSEILTVSGTTLTLTDVPVGTAGAEIPYIYAVDNTGYNVANYALGPTATENTFTLDAATKKITLPTGMVNGTRVMVNYTAEREDAARFSANATDNPMATETHLWVKCHNVCDPSTIVYGILVCYNAQLSPDYTINFGSDAEQALNMTIMPSYCTIDKRLFDFFFCA